MNHEIRKILFWLDVTVDTAIVYSFIIVIQTERNSVTHFCVTAYTA